MTDQERIFKLRAALTLAAQTFRVYEDMHLAKGAREKATRNGEFAEEIEKTLKDTE